MKTKLKKIGTKIDCIDTAVKEEQITGIPVSGTQREHPKQIDYYS